MSNYSERDSGGNVHYGMDYGRCTLDRDETWFISPENSPESGNQDVLNRYQHGPVLKVHLDFISEN